MARRSPANPRYQRDAKIGSTRRSASSAKPKREAGATAPASKTSERPPSPLRPQSAEERKWRRVWWGLMGVALACVGLAFLPGIRTNPQFMRFILAVELGAIAAALALDFTKIRQARKAALDAARSGAKRGEAAAGKGRDAGKGTSDR